MRHSHGLVLYPTFNVGLGYRRSDFNDANSKLDRGIRVVPVLCGAGCIRFLVFARVGTERPTVCPIPRSMQETVPDTFLPYRHIT